MGIRRANGNEILAIGGGCEKQFLYTAETVHRAFLWRFNKYFEVGRKKWYRRSTGHPMFRMYREGKDYREKVRGGMMDPSSPPDLQGSMGALQTKTVGEVLLIPSLYTGVVTDDGGDIIPTSKEKWSWHWKGVATGKAPGDSGVTTDMLRLAPGDVLESYRDIANATL